MNIKHFFFQTIFELKLNFIIFTKVNLYSLKQRQFIKLNFMKENFVKTVYLKCLRHLTDNVIYDYEWINNKKQKIPYLIIKI